MTRCLAPSCAQPTQAGQFCELHAKSPPGQRGGWVSAAKRKPYDASAVAPRLWIGARPPFDSPLPKVDLLVLCAEEIQPERMAFQGTVARCPIPDDALDAEQKKLVAATSAVVARTVAQGQRALVTCAAGLNRSALVVALALHQLTTMSADQIIAHIRKHRSPQALYNQHFQKMIKSIVGDGRPKARRTTAG